MRSQGGGDAKARGKGKRAQKEDWHEFSLQTIVPPASQGLAFVMVPCMRSQGDYDLSMMELRARIVQHTTLTASPDDPFSPIPMCMDGLQLMPFEDVSPSTPRDDEGEDLELLAALAASMAEEIAPEGIQEIQIRPSGLEPTQVDDSDRDCQEDEPDLELE